MQREYVGADGHPTNWRCPCGNRPYELGFFPCSLDGSEVEPTAQAWPLPLYVCDGCGRIVDQATRLVVGRRQTAVPTPRRLPEFAGYTVDARLRQFRKVPTDALPEFVAFDSPEGEALLTRLHQALLDGTWRFVYTPMTA